MLLWNNSIAYLKSVLDGKTDLNLCSYIDPSLFDWRSDRQTIIGSD